MPRDHAILQILLAVLFGCLYQFVLPALEPYISLLAYPMASTVRDLGVTERTTFKIVNLGFWILVYGMVSGLIFGLPLGYLVRPHWLRAWVAFVIVAIGGFLFAMFAGYGFSDFLASAGGGYLWSWTMLGMWGQMLVVGLFMWLGSRLRPRLRHPTHVAP